MVGREQQPSATREGGPRKVAIIGSGIAGLSCSWLLANSDFEVHIFEKHKRLGMDAHAVEVNETRVDTPPRAFSHEYYPNLSGLYKAAGIDSVPFSWAFTYFEKNKQHPYLKVGDGATASSSRLVFGFRCPSFSTLESALHLLHPLNLWALIDTVRFHKRAQTDYDQYCTTVPAANPLMAITLDEYLQQGGHSQRFRDMLLLPMLAMVCTCSFEAVLRYPAWLIVEYSVLNSSYQQKRTKQTIDQVADILSNKVSQIHLGSWIQSVVPASDAHSLPTLILGDGSKLEFDHVIFGTDATSAVPLLPAGSEWSQVLGQFEYQKSDVVVHTHAAVMPHSRLDWGAANLCLSEPLQHKQAHQQPPPPQQQHKQHKQHKQHHIQHPPTREVMFTLLMSHPDNCQHRPFPAIRQNNSNQQQQQQQPDLFMTWNPLPDMLPTTPTNNHGGNGHHGNFQPTGNLPKDSLFAHITFVRSLVTPNTRDATDALGKLQGKGSLWFVGAYTQFRVPLQENAVMSSVYVSRKLGANIPWDKATTTAAAAAATERKVSISKQFETSPKVLVTSSVLVLVLFALGMYLMPCVSEALLGQQPHHHQQHSAHGWCWMTTTMTMLLATACGVFGGVMLFDARTHTNNSSNQKIQIALGAFTACIAIIVATTTSNSASVLSMLLPVGYFVAFLSCLATVIANFPITLGLAYLPSSLLSVPFSFTALLITWYHIFSFFCNNYTASNEASSAISNKNMFIEAYANVVSMPGWAWASQLLLFVVSACVFFTTTTATTSINRFIKPQVQLAYILTAFLGAVSLAFPLFLAHIAILRASGIVNAPNTLTHASTKPVAETSLATSHVMLLRCWWVCAAIAIYCTIALPFTVESRDESPLFAVFLITLHVVLVIPFVMQCFLPPCSITASPSQQEKGVRKNFYITQTVIAVVCGVYHLSLLKNVWLDEGKQTNSRALASTISNNPCLASITWDVILTSIAVGIFMSVYSRVCKNKNNVDTDDDGNEIIAVDDAIIAKIGNRNSNKIKTSSSSNMTVLFSIVQWSWLIVVVVGVLVSNLIPIGFVFGAFAALRVLATL